MNVLYLKHYVQCILFLFACSFGTVYGLEHILGTMLGGGKSSPTPSREATTKSSQDGVTIKDIAKIITGLSSQRAPAPKPEEQQPTEQKSVGQMLGDILGLGGKGDTAIAPKVEKQAALQHEFEVTFSSVKDLMALQSSLDFSPESKARLLAMQNNLMQTISQYSKAGGLLTGSMEIAIRAIAKYLQSILGGTGMGSGLSSILSGGNLGSTATNLKSTLESIEPIIVGLQGIWEKLSEDDKVLVGGAIRSFNTKSHTVNEGLSLKTIYGTPYRQEPRAESDKTTTATPTTPSYGGGILDTLFSVGKDVLLGNKAVPAKP